MKVYHLSHIDLDGYGCQLVSSEFFKDIKFYNANYGREVSVRLHSILDDIVAQSNVRAKNAESDYTDSVISSEEKHLSTTTQDSVIPSETKHLNTAECAVMLSERSEAKHLNTTDSKTPQNLDSKVAFPPPFAGGMGGETTTNSQNLNSTDSTNPKTDTSPLLTQSLSMTTNQDSISPKVDTSLRLSMTTPPHNLDTKIIESNTQDSVMLSLYEVKAKHLNETKTNSKEKTQIIESTFAKLDASRSLLSMRSDADSIKDTSPLLTQSLSMTTKQDSINPKIDTSQTLSITKNQDSINPNTTNNPQNLNPIKPPKNKQKFIILITDLNLTPSESRFLSEQVRDLKFCGLDIEIILLDHHATGLESAQTYEWYFLDTSRCATKITYEYLLERFGLNDSKQEWLKPMVEMINSVDIWLEDGFGFEFGKVAMSLIATSNELNRYMFDNENREYKLWLLKSAYQFFREYESKAGGLIAGKAFDEVAFDNAIFFLKKKALGGDKDSETMDNIISRAQVRLLASKKEACKVYYEDKVGFLSYCMGGISVVANRFLRENADEFDFYIDVGNRGNVSLRANGNCDVSALSQLCFNGGGHKNASGGRMDGFKESFLYDDIKAQVQDYLDNKDAWTQS